MIKFKKELNNGRVLLGFGISEGNLKKLKAGDPILFHLEELGLEGFDVTIMYGETEADIANKTGKVVQNVQDKYNH